MPSPTTSDTKHSESVVIRGVAVKNEPDPGPNDCFFGKSYIFVPSKNPNRKIMTRKFLPLVALLATVCMTLLPARSLASQPVEETSADTLNVAPSRSHIDIDMTLELMSSYVCRGAYQTGASFQPTLEASWRGLYLKAWGSTDLDAHMREIDLTLGYRIQRFNFMLTDYYVTPAAGGGFFTGGARGPHIFEAAVFWSVSERVPIGIWWGTVFAGADVADNGQRNYSSYAEISYPFTVRDFIDMKAGVGFMPWSTQNCFNTEGFAVTNVYLKATKMWTLRGQMRIGLLAHVILNPYREELNFVGGLRFEL